jgi:hypothetical protein
MKVVLLKELREETIGLYAGGCKLRYDSITLSYINKSYCVNTTVYETSGRAGKMV